ADFQTIAVDPANGCAALALPGDPYNRPDLPGGENTNGSSTYFAKVADPAACFTAKNAGQPAGTITDTPVTTNGATGATCLDRTPPSTRVRRVKRSHRGTLRVSGTAHDRGCGAKGRGTVARVRIAVARRVGKRCRFVTASGRLTRARKCARPPLRTV